MKHTKKWRQILCVMVAVLLLFGVVSPAAAASEGDGDVKDNDSNVIVEEDNTGTIKGPSPLDYFGTQSGEGTKSSKQRGEITAVENANELVRVSIILNAPSAMDITYGIAPISEDLTGEYDIAAIAAPYRAEIRSRQDKLQAKIESEILGGAALDVVWNLTLAANLISANVPRYAIDRIEELPEVKAVVEETLYRPQVDSVGGELEPNMAVSGQMNGTSTVWANGAGYTGAGTTIAIVDTGLDIDHISFDEGAFEYSLSQIEGFDTSTLLDAEKIDDVLPQLNVYARNPSLTAEDLYKNAKVPFGYNYIDDTADYITHMGDAEGEHGSHVAGIAAANRYVPSDSEEGEPYVDALSTVRAAGNAPDAQILVMKVFGIGGGAYDSDYMAAIEDAIALGADSVNLSLGSAMAGASTDSEYQAILDKVSASSTVLSMSAGNSGSWAENTLQGNLYNDGVNFDTVGSPGSYNNSFTVASVDNDGFVGPTVQVGEGVYGFSNSSGAMEPFPSLDISEDGAGTDLPLLALPVESAGLEDLYLEEIGTEAVAGKVVMVWRGTTNFSVKAQTASDAGAIAVIIANNQSGTINADVTGYTGEAPVATITQAAGLEILAALTENEAGYSEGTIKVVAAPSAVLYGSDEYTQSSFSSWGVPGSLTLKPEITAPGGGIYSVWGANTGADAATSSHTDYELMSGTSMAAPQIAGLSALVQQYIRSAVAEGQLRVPGSMNSRDLTQSLLMSTALQMTIDGEYYPVIQQGAGLVGVDRAVSTPVTITVDGQANGKVKVELGDDPDREGVYTFEFTLHNLTEEDQEYTLSADVFTQLVEEGSYYGIPDIFLTQTTRAMSADVSFTDESGETLTGGVVSVPGAEDVTVEATIALTDAEIQKLAEGNPAGAYIEAFVHAVNTPAEDGAIAPDLGIPVLGYYGSWSESSMYDIGQIEANYGDRYPYLYNSVPYPSNVAYISYGSPEFEGMEVAFWGNPLSDEPEGYEEGIEEPIYEHNAMSNEDGSMITEYEYSLIRNAGGSYVSITDAQTGEIYYEQDLGSEDGAFYYSGSGSWQYTTGSIGLNWAGTDAHGDPLPEGTEVNITVYHVPEYYAGEDGSYDWATLADVDSEDSVLKSGAYLRTPLVIDNTAPELVDSEDSVYDEETGTGLISLTLRDNRHIAAIIVSLYDEESGSVIPFYGELPCQMESGEDLSVEINSIYDEETDEEYPLVPGMYLVDVYDYAMNQKTYRVYLGVDPAEDVEGVVISDEAIELYAGNSYQLEALTLPYTLPDTDVTWSSDAPKVATVSSSGRVTAVEEGTATITATSNIDSSFTATCTVTVKRAHGIITGVLSDVDGTPRSFTYDIAIEDLTMGGYLDQNPMAATQVDDETFYMSDPNGVMYLMDLTTGKAIGDGVPQTVYTPWDLAYVDGVGMFSTYLTYLLGPDDPMSLTGYGYNLGSYFMGLAVDPTPWTEIDEEDGVEYSGDFGLYAIDLDGYVWHLLLTYDEEMGWMLFNGGVYSSDVPIDSLALNDNGDPYASLVYGYDGALYYSMYTGDTNELYRLELVEDPYNGPMYKAARIGDVGADVWPAAILSVTAEQLPPPPPPAEYDPIEPVEPPVRPGPPDAEIGPDPDPVISVTTGETPSDEADEEPTTETTVVPETTVVDDTASSTVSDAEGAEIVEQAKDGGSSAVVIAPDMPEDVTKTEVTISGDTVSDIAAETDADLRVETPTAQVTVPHEALAELGEGSSVTVSAERKDDTLEIAISVDDETVTSVPGGVKASFELADGEVAVLVDEDGNETVIPKSIIEDGVTYVLLDGSATLKIVDNSKDFDDVAGDDWYKSAIDFASSHELFNGTSETSFDPDVSMTRAMMVTVLWRLENETPVEDAPSFPDVSDDAWYAGGIAWAGKNGIIQGTDSGDAEPDHNLTRQEMALMLYRYASDVAGIDTSRTVEFDEFTDADEVADWAEDAMKWAVSTGLFRGSDGLLNPSGEASRAEIATVLQRLIAMIVK